MHSAEFLSFSQRLWLTHVVGRRSLSCGRWRDYWRDKRRLTWFCWEERCCCFAPSSHAVRRKCPASRLAERAAVRVATGPRDQIGRRLAPSDVTHGPRGTSAFSTYGVFDLQRRWQRCRSSSLVIVSWQRLIDINDDELARKEQTHTYLMTGTTHIWSQLTDYHTDVYNVNVAAACEELEAHLIGVTHCWVAFDQPRQNCGQIVWIQYNICHNVMLGCLLSQWLRKH